MAIGGRALPEASDADLARFWQKVDTSGECWTWNAGGNGQGYGSFGLQGRTVAAHRLAYQIANGHLDSDAIVDHICHTRSCVRPDHLRIVTPKQNMENRSGPHRNNKCGVRGVYWNGRKNKWHAQVRHDNRVYFAGYYDELEDAAVGVAAKRNELFTHNETDRD